MSGIKLSGTFTGAGFLSAMAASLCCVLPVIALLAGSSSLAASFSWLEPARPYLIGVSLVVLAIAWYSKLKPVKTTTMDCNCEIPKKVSFLQSKAFLAIVTVVAIGLMSFPLYANIFYPQPQPQATPVALNDTKQQVRFAIQGMTCAGCESHVNKELAKVKGVEVFNTSYSTNSSLVTFDQTEVDVKTITAAIQKTGYKVTAHNLVTASTSTVSFYKAPLVCQAAPSIGCGSKAKFMLIDLEKHKEAVEGAWLNKKGTVVAVKWLPNTANGKRAEIIQTVSTSHNIGITALASAESKSYTASFPKGSAWYKGKEVDKLSQQEAAIIAKNTIAGYKKEGLIKPAFEKQFEKDITGIYTNLFLSISSYKDLTTEAYNKVERQIQQAGEKYVGKGKMPHVELCTATSLVFGKEPACSAESGKSCCSKK
ncbi:mercuric transport protein MerTP [Pontibacter vulgaris]|uniref:mercuric transport protein MerTP n=1 Tax=Pontibacter vulgaris TaxID=2905679 RepID=UPI001FA7B1E8|nr:mercuric transport protein MerTP [Pontibacter vulgaris]